VELGQNLLQLIVVLWNLLVELLTLGLHWSLLIAWIAWWLCAVNWSKLWPVLAKGAWAPVVLIMVIAALAWSCIAPSERYPNFWWQLGSVSLLGALTLFCGWLQGVFGWQPAEINLHPPVVTVHAHDHDDSAGPEHRAVEEFPREAGHHHHGHH
jgi:hypothetical protein